MGHIIGAAGVKPDGSKVAEIQQLAPPTDRKALQRLLGMTRYLAQYLPDESTLTAPLRQLLRKGIDWQWHPEHQMAFDKLKKAVSSAPLLRFFNPKEEIVIQADASKDTLSRAHPLTGSSEEGDLGDEKEQLPSNQREPLLPHPVPDAPWQRIAADIFELNGRPFLLITDYYSKFPEVLQLPDKTAGSVIARFKAVFSRHGVPFTLTADHVPFASVEIARIASKWGFKIIHSSPAFPQSNRMVARAIKTVKAMLTAAAQNGVDPHLAMLNLRNTPVTGMAYSPAQLLMGRVLRSNLPISNATLQPSTPVNVREGLAMARCQWRQKESYDKTAAPLLPFRTGERVRMETAQGWQPASIVRAREEPRSYDIITPSGATYRRNRKHLRPDRAARHDDQQDDIDASDSDTEQAGTSWLVRAG
ncbi:hypothetical protein AAFF_G00112520 [Aldrovandia affinis]|uniref:Integrase catalytic domain-containing protein n=1 Tax=Aldrovandia affinis TaxID=143900 RepID=A0AAD7WAI6_9TELE|nr:hypothetical protein AAFF_G00112520 [Aldrovandia affinis]